MFGGVGSGYRIHATFQNAGQLVNGNRVTIGGNPAGEIVDIKLADDNQVEITLEIDDQYAPLHEGSALIQRREGLAGVANGYISLNPGPGNREEIADGGRIGLEHTTSVVDLNQFYNIFDEDMRKDVRTVIRQLSVAFGGRGKDANRAFKYLGPALGSTSNVVDELVGDEAVFERFLIDTSRLVTALAERKDDLAALVSNADTATGAIAKESVALGEALNALPSTIKIANTTFANLRDTLDELDPLVQDLEPAADALDPFLKDLRPVLRDGKSAIVDIRRILYRKGSDNDIVDLLRDTPSLGKKSDTVFPATIEALKDLQPIFDFGVPYSPDLTGFITGLAEVPAAYDANGHFARIQGDFMNFTDNGSTLTQLPDSQRGSGLQTGRVRRCPGGATQASADGSNPFLPSPSFDCDPSTVPPGP